MSNINQQSGSSWTGLDGLHLQVPVSALISNITSPASYRSGSGGYWKDTLLEAPPGDVILNASEAPLQVGYQWLQWWGSWPASTYPAGTTASFSFQADGVALGTSLVIPTTYWGTYYTSYSTELVSPVAINSVPLPPALFLFSSAIAGMVSMRRGRRI